MDPFYSEFISKLLGQKFYNRYKIERHLCAGSFGNVFLVEDELEINYKEYKFNFLFISNLVKHRY